MVRATLGMMKYWRSNYYPSSLNANPERIFIVNRLLLGMCRAYEAFFVCFLFGPFQRGYATQPWMYLGGTNWPFPWFLQMSGVSWNTWKLKWFKTTSKQPIDVLHIFYYIFGCSQQVGWWVKSSSCHNLSHPTSSCKLHDFHHEKGKTNKTWLITVNGCPAMWTSSVHLVDTSDSPATGYILQPRCNSALFARRFS